MRQEQAQLGAVKVTATVRKGPPGWKAAGKEPDETLTVDVWQESDGTLITDPERIAELEARLEEDEQSCH